MKIAKSKKFILERCIVDFDKKRFLLRLLSLSHNIYKVMLVFVNVWPAYFKKSCAPPPDAPSRVADLS
jgi:hypothetical protein